MPNVRTYGKLIEAAAKAASLKDAEKWFEELESVSDQIGQAPYIMLIDAAARERDVAAAERWLKRLADSGQPLDIVAFHGVMSAAAAARDMKTSSTWLQKMCDSNIEPNEMTLIVVAEKLAEAGDIHAAEEWLNKATNQSQYVLATSQVILSIIRSAANDCLPVAEQLLRKITLDLSKAKTCPGVSREASDLRCLALKEMVKMHLDRGNQESVERWLQATRCANCDKDVFRKIYLEMLKTSAANGKLARAEQIFSDARHAGFNDLHFSVSWWTRLPNAKICLQPKSGLKKPSMLGWSLTWCFSPRWLTQHVALGMCEQQSIGRAEHRLQVSSPTK